MQVSLACALYEHKEPGLPDLAAKLVMDVVSEV